MLWGRTSVTCSNALHWEAVKPEVWSDQHWEEQGKTIAICCTRKTQILRFELFNSFDILVIADRKPPNRQLTSPDCASKNSKQLLNFEWTVDPEKNFFAHNQLRCFSHSNSTLAKSDFKLPSCARQSLRMQQTGEIHRNPSTSESNTPNGAVGRVHFPMKSVPSTCAFAGPSKQRQTISKLCFDTNCNLPSVKAGQTRRYAIKYSGYIWFPLKEMNSRKRSTASPRFTTSMWYEKLGEVPGRKKTAKVFTVQSKPRNHNPRPTLRCLLHASQMFAHLSCI